MKAWFESSVFTKPPTNILRQHVKRHILCIQDNVCHEFLFQNCTAPPQHPSPIMISCNGILQHCPKPRPLIIIHLCLQPFFPCVSTLATSCHICVSAHQPLSACYASLSFFLLRLHASIQCPHKCSNAEHISCCLLLSELCLWQLVLR